MPGEVSVALRGGHTTRERVDVGPDAGDLRARRRPWWTRTAAGAAFEVVRRLELLLDHWGANPPTELRAGGLGVRELKAAASHLHVDEATAALLVEVAAEARLLASRYDEDGNAVFAPTDDFDAWTRLPTAERWSRVARAWWGTSRLPGLVGTRDAAGKAHSALAPENTSIFAVDTRRSALVEIADIPDGHVLAAGTGPASLVARLAWLRPAARAPAATRWRGPCARRRPWAWSRWAACRRTPGRCSPATTPRRSSRPCSRSPWTTCSSRRT